MGREQNTHGKARVTSRSGGNDVRIEGYATICQGERFKIAYMSKFGLAGSSAVFFRLETSQPTKQPRFNIYQKQPLFRLCYVQHILC